MLESLRKHSRSALIYVLFGIIIIVFVVSFGPGGGCGAVPASGHMAASVNGKEISVSDFQREYAQTLRQYQQQTGGAFDEAMAEKMGLRGQVLDRLIGSEVLKQLAAKAGIVVTDLELSQRISKIPSFQKDGVFDQELYESFVSRQLGFEDAMRADVLREKMVEGLALTAQVSDDEVRADFIKQHEKIDLDYVRFSPAHFTSTVEAPPAAEVDQYLKDNPGKVEEYFKSHGWQFRKPARVTARQIFFKAEEGAPDAVIAKARAKAEAAHERAVKPGADFAAIAKEVSEDVATRMKGGDVGTVSMGFFSLPVQAAAFALKKGEVSQVVQDKKGFTIVKAEGVLDAEMPAFEGMERQVAEAILKNEAAKKVAKAKAEETLAQLRTGKKLTDLFPVREEGPTMPEAEPKPMVDSTGPFSPSADYIPRLGSEPEVASAAAALSETKPFADRTFAMNDAVLVIALKSREHADMAQFAEKLPELREDFRDKAADDLLQGVIDAAKAKFNVVRNEALFVEAAER